MRRTNSFTLKIGEGEELKVEVYEVRPKDLMDIHKEIQREKLPLGEYERLLPFCTNLTKEQLASLYPNEMEEVITHFKDVNKSFLAPWPTIKVVIEKVGLGNWLADLLKESKLMDLLKTALSVDLQRLSASSLSEVTSDLRSMDGGTSESPSTSEKKPGSSKPKPMH